MIVRVRRHWNRLPGEDKNAPCLKMFKARLRGSELPGLMRGVPAHGSEVGAR